MNQFVTFHDILNILENFQEQSPILNSFGYGNLVDFGRTNSGETQNQTVEYPYLFVVPQSIQYDENTTTYQLTLIFADILNTDMANQKDCVSNMSLEAKRLLSYIKFGQNTFPEIYNSFDVELPSSAIPFLERMGDHVAGVALDANIIVFEVLDACDYYPEPSPTPVPVTATPTPTVSPTPGLPSSTPTNTPTNTSTPTTTPTNTQTQTPTNTSTPTTTPTNTPTNTTTPTNTPTQTSTTTPTTTPTQTETPTNTPTNTPTQTSTTTPTSTPTQTMTPTPSSTPPVQTCDLYYFSGSTTVQYTPCSGGTVNETITGGQYRELLSGTLSYTGGTPEYISPAPSVTYIDALETAGYTATTIEQQSITEFFGGVYTLPNGKTEGYGAIQYMYPLIGGTSATCQINAINPGTDDLTFYNSPTFNMSGVTWNGSSTYALIGTGKTQSDIGSQNSTHAAIYLSTPCPQVTNFGSRSFSPDSRFISRGIDASSFVNYTVNWNNITAYGGPSILTGRTGPLIVFRYDASNIGFTTNYTDSTTSATSVAPTNLYFGVGASFTDGNVVFEYDSSRASFYSFGYMIERTTSIGQYAIYISQLQTKLGRQAN